MVEEEKGKEIRGGVLEITVVFTVCELADAIPAGMLEDGSFATGFSRFAYSVMRISESAPWRLTSPDARPRRPPQRCSRLPGHGMSHWPKDVRIRLSAAALVPHQQTLDEESITISNKVVARGGNHSRIVQRGVFKFSTRANAG